MTFINLDIGTEDSQVQNENNKIASIKKRKTSENSAMTTK